MFSSLGVIFYILLNLGIAKSGRATGHYCKKENNVTVTCNYIPDGIPKGTETVNFILEVTNDTTLENNTFLSDSWGKIKVLELRAYLTVFDRNLFLREKCFEKLKDLRDLRLHVTCSLYIYPETFVGLNDVNTLDLSGSVRFDMNDLVQALNGSDKVPKLSNLILSNCSLYRSSIRIDIHFIKALETKKVSFVDISGLQFSAINLTAAFKRLKYLKFINTSYISVDDMTANNLEQDDLEHIKSFDVSHAHLPPKLVNIPPGKLLLSNFSVKFSEIMNKYFEIFLTPKAVNVSGIIPHLSSIWIRNVTVEIDENTHYLTLELISRQNNLRRLDTTLKCDNFDFPSFERINLSENELEFLHPDILACAPKLKKIDLSVNKLVKMARENMLLFESIFSRSKFLENINLLNNELIMIPIKIFENTRNIKTIDLSSNTLDQVQFTLVGLNKLELLDLQGNNIHTLDAVSVNYLDSIPNRYATVILKANPLSCSRCETKSFLAWIMSAKFVNVSSQKLKCLTENGMSEYINENTVVDVEKICERTTIIIATSACVGAIVLLLFAVLLIYYVRRKHANIVQNRANVINLLRKGEGCFEFAVFLAFSNDDEDIVNRHILNPLNENLQLMTGVDRELVCTGDRHFRPGHYVHNETYRRLDTASVMIVVASNNFCRSNFCRNELDQAYVKKKPIVLMFIEHIDQDVMIPTMKELYQRNVRILWTLENGEFKMKTSWENVCTSILDLIH